MPVNSTLENKKYFNKEEALVRMVTGIPMKMEKGTQYYCYAEGVFFVSDSLNFKNSREWNPNNSSAIPDWVNLQLEPISIGSMVKISQT